MSATSGAWQGLVYGKAGSSVCVVGEKLYKWRGYGARQGLDANELVVFDFSSRRWSVEPVRAVKGSTYPKAHTNSACTSIGSSMYVFGGLFSRLSMYRSELHKINVLTKELELLSPKNSHEGPIQKHICGMVSVGSSKLLIFGGFGEGSPHSRLQPGASYDWSEELQAMWTNEIHLLDLQMMEWSDVKTTGTPPPPCAGFSLTRVDQTRVVLFGGRQVQARVNDLYILDVVSWVWSCLLQEMHPGLPWPRARSMHSVVNLVDPLFITGHSSVTVALGESKDCCPPKQDLEQKLLVLWGQDQEEQKISDGWILHLKDFHWQELSLPDILGGRTFHRSAAFYPTPGEAIVVTTGGYVMKHDDCTRFKDTFVIHSGIQSLYSLCLRWITDHLPAPLATALAQFLPKHIISDLQEYFQAEEGFNQFARFKV